MRITCPNCGAQYEVPEEVIPQDGRDVQCSNCGVTWFQDHPDFPQDAPEAPSEAADGRAADDDPAEDMSDEAPAGPEEDEDDRTVIAPPPRPAPAAAPEAPADRREIDPSVADILREEAQHEARLRATDAPDPLETQPELGLETSTVAARARDRAERLRRGAAEAEEVHSRRDLLPDIEEINSTLRSDGGKQLTRRAEMDELDEDDAPTGNSFARGFATMVILAVLVVLLYLNAPMLSQKVPALDGALNGLVNLIDKARFWLDAQVKGLTG